MSLPFFNILTGFTVSVHTRSYQDGLSGLKKDEFLLLIFQASETIFMFSDTFRGLKELRCLEAGQDLRASTHTLCLCVIYGAFHLSKKLLYKCTILMHSLKSYNLTFSVFRYVELYCFPT